MSDAFETYDVISGRSIVAQQAEYRSFCQETNKGGVMRNKPVEIKEIRELLDIVQEVKAEGTRYLGILIENDKDEAGYIGHAISLEGRNMLSWAECLYKGDYIDPVYLAAQHIAVDPSKDDRAGVEAFLVKLEDAEIQAPRIDAIHCARG